MRALAITEKLYKEKPDVAQRLMYAFVEATDYFIKNPQAAEKYVREDMFKNQITSQDFTDAIGNSPYSYDLSLSHVQLTTDLMKKYGVGKLQDPVPKASDWVKLDLLAKAKAKLNIK